MQGQFFFFKSLKIYYTYEGKAFFGLLRAEGAGNYGPFLQQAGKLFFRHGREIGQSLQQVHSCQRRLR